jgi:hypothetical protein
MSAEPGHSGLIPAAFTMLAALAISLRTKRVNSAGVMLIV